MGIGELVDSYNKLESRQTIVLSLSSIHKIKLKYKELHKTTIEINESDSLKDITFRLKVSCIENYLRQQKYVYRCKSDHINFSTKDFQISPQRIKKVNKVINHSGEEMSGQLILSARKALKLFGINACDFKPFQNFTSNQLGWVWHTKNKISKPCCYEEFKWAPKNYSQRGYLYWYKGFEILHLPSSISVPSI
jgi:hypothetical protein